MRHYLSFGGGVNSVALYLLMEQLEIEFEAIFVNHGGDWPETYEYVENFISTGRHLTVLKPSVNTIEKVVFDSIVDYCEHRKVVPSRASRWCTDRFKIRPVYGYIEKPCFMHIGIDAGESHRAVLSSRGGVENRFLLLEHDIDREGCKQLIRNSGLEVPRKSGCFICPFQGSAEYRELRRRYPELFCKAANLELAQNARVTKNGKPWKPYYLSGSVPLAKLETQMVFPGLSYMEYPPCECGL